jgi:hypothetical protein
MTDWRQRRQERATELAPLREARLKHQLAGEEAVAKHNLAMQGLGDKAAQKRGKSIPSSQEYGRKAVGGGRGASGGGKGGGFAGGSGAGRSKSGLGSTGTGPGGKKNSPKTSTGSGLLGRGTGSQSPKSPKSSGGSGKSGSSGKNGGSGSGIKPPSKGKSPSAKDSSPALERARGRQDRAAARQSAKVQRGADRQAARLEHRKKNQDAVRDRTGRAKDARQDTKDRVRNARVDAKEARKEQVRADRFEAKRKARKARSKARRKKKEAAAAANAGRTTLRQVVAKAAQSRLAGRRTNLARPVLTTGNPKKTRNTGAATSGPKISLTKTPKPGAGSGTPPKVSLTKKPKQGGGAGTKAPGPKISLTKKPKQGGTGTAPPAAKKPKPGGKKGPGRKKPRVKSKKSRSGAAGATGPADRRKAYRKERAQRASERARAKAESATADDPTGPGPGAGWTFYEPPREERRSAYDSMRDTDPQQQEVWTAEQVFPAGYQASGNEALTTGARALPAGTGSGSASTTIKKEAPMGSSPSVRTPMDNGISPEHATEVTLDDVVDFLDEVVSDAFTAHDECLLLAAHAKEIMYVLDELAARLAAKHNIIGAITSWAMSKLAESMEVLSRKAEEMSAKSLLAAETCETAKTEMDDAYRPLTQATADAGLRTPSARVHNEN